MKKLLLTTALILSQSALIAWGAGAGTTGTNFLKICPYARAAGMAEAFIAVSDGTYGLFYNPAGLNSILGYEAQFTHISWFRGINYESFAIVNPDPLLDWGKIGLAVSYIQTGAMRRTYDLPGYDHDYLNSGISFSDYMGNEFTPKSYTIVFGYSLDPTEDLSVGLNMKLTTDYLAEFRDSNVSVDLGAMYKILYSGSYLRAGLVLGNIGTKVTMGDNAYDPPMNITLGISDLFLVCGYDFLVSTQIIIPYDSSAVFSMGAEYWFYDMAALRLGVKVADSIQPSIGAGVKYKNFEFDYAFVNYEGLGNTHRFSLLAAWGTPPARLKVAPFLVSPNNDGFLDKVYFTPVLQEKDMINSVRINIYDEKGETLIVSIPAKSKDQVKTEWDGTKDGKPVADGKYLASVAADYAVNGTSESNKVELEVHNTPPEVSLEAGPVFDRPGKDPALLIPVTFTFFAKDSKTIDRWQLNIWDKDKKIFFSAGGRGMPPLSYTWDGKGSNGEYAGTNELYYYSFGAHDILNNGSQTPPVAKDLLVKEIKIIFSSDALFDPGAADVKVTAYKMVKDMKKVIAQYPGTKLIVAGHTDNVQPSGKKYTDNIALSKSRADAVKFFMVNMMGIEQQRIFTEGDGELYPIAPNDTPENRGKNRRVEIIIRSTVYK